MNAPPSADPQVKRLAADIAKELREHPDHWTRGSDARDINGDKVDALHSEATCWCLEGHIIRRSPGGFGMVREFAKAADIPCLWQWNDDDPKRTVKDIIDLCERVAA